jgi:hypothetical protein
LWTSGSTFLQPQRLKTALEFGNQDFEGIPQKGSPPILSKDVPAGTFEHSFAFYLISGS